MRSLQFHHINHRRDHSVRVIIRVDLPVRLLTPTMAHTSAVVAIVLLSLVSGTCLCVRVDLNRSLTPPLSAVSNVVWELVLKPILQLAVGVGMVVIGGSRVLPSSMVLLSTASSSFTSAVLYCWAMPSIKSFVLIAGPEACSG